MNAKQLIITICCLIGLYNQQTYACVIALTNDSNKTLLIVTDDFKEGIILPAGGFIEFGSKAYMANFRIMQPNGKNFTEQHHVEQTACTPGKYTKLKVSEITSNPNIPFKVSQATQKIVPQKSGCGCGH